MDSIKTDFCDIHYVEEYCFVLSNGPDLISQHLKSGNAWEPITLDISKHLIEGVTSPVLIDVGANLGAWSVAMGMHVNSVGGRVFSFEPQRPVYYQLCANFFANNLFNCFSHNLAVGDYCGSIDIPFLDIHDCANLGALSISEEIREEQGWIQSPTAFETVTIATLDSMSLPIANLIKIDVEGLELEVIRGAEKWLKKSNNPPVIFEVWGDYMKNMTEKRNELFSLLKNRHGYDIYQNGEMCVALHKENSNGKADILSNFNII